MNAKGKALSSKVGRIKPGDTVSFKRGPDKNKYTVYGSYPKGRVSLSLKDYPDVEQDSQIERRRLRKQ